MAADGNTAPITANAPSETSVSGDQPAIMPVIVQDTTGAITRDSISTISKPDTGTIRVIDTGNLPEINFSFAAKDVKLSALDVDLVMIFNDNSKIILPNLAMDLVGANPPRLTFKGSVASPQAVVAQIGQTSLVEITPSVQLSSPDFLPRKKGGNTNNSDQNTTGQNGIGGGEPPVPPQPVVSGAKSGKTGENDGAKTADFSAPPLEKVQASNIANGTTPNAFSSASVIPTAMKADPLASATAYSFSQVPVIAKMYQIVEAHPQQTGTNMIYGGSGASPADTDYRFAEQIKAETLTGTDASDNIYADNPAFSAGGMAGRVISITPSLATGFTMDTLVISGVPSLYKVLNGTALGGDETHGYSYKINAYSNGSSEFRLQLAYQVPDNVTSQNSMDAKAVLSLTFTGVKTGTAQSVTASGSIYFNVSDVANDAEQITTNYTDGITVVNLSFHPAGNSIAGGAGDDTIHAAAGADAIDGGTGNDSFTGDYNANYLGGGAGADTLLGSLGSDTLSGGLGNDSLDGNGTSVDPYAVDVVDYTYATAGVTLSVGSINSSTAYTFSVGGSATDVDTLKNFEGIIGGSGNDSLTGDSNANYLSGGSGGADTLSGGGGNDILKLDWSSLNLSNLDGGAGNDTVVLTGTGSVSLNFTQASFTGVLTNAEYLDFSAATSANKVSLNIDGAGIQKILTGATSNTNAGTLDLKLDTGHYDTLTLATNASYTYSNTSSAADASRLSGAVNVSTLNAAGSDIYVFDSTHTTLLAQLHYHT